MKLWRNFITMTKLLPEIFKEANKLATREERIAFLRENQSPAMKDIIRIAFDKYGFKTEVLAASIRSLEHVEKCLLVGADAITAPPKILEMLVNHPLTEKGLNQFVSDWAKSKQKI